MRSFAAAHGTTHSDTAAAERVAGGVVERAPAPLARACLRQKRTDDARKIIEDALATPWNTADLHAAAAEIFTAAGDTARERERSVALDPDALEG